MQGAHLALLRRLVEVAPRTCTVRDLRGRMPLHLAAGVGGADLPTVQFLLSLDESVARARDDDGLTPCHHALVRRAPLEISWLLLSKHLELLQQQDVVQSLLELCVRACACVYVWC